MRTLRTLLFASLLILGSLLIVSATDPPKAPDDAFMCFKASVSPGTPRFLKPDPMTVISAGFYGDETAISKPSTLCIPVERDGRPPTDPATSLVSYSFRLSGVRQSTILNVPVLDSFGPHWMDLSKFELYSAPSVTNPAIPPMTPPYSTDNVDRFACAKAKQNKAAGAFPRTLTTTITDELTHQTRVMALKKPSHLCFPANARGDGMKNQRGALMCYQAAPAAGQPKHIKQHSIQVFNEFQAIKLDTKGDSELCVPARANIGPLALLQASPTAGTAPLSVSFSGLGSVAPLGKTIQFAWDLGDGGASTAPAFTHTYTVPGVYNVTLFEDVGPDFLGGLDEVTIEVAEAPTPSPSPTPTASPSPSPSPTPTPSPTPSPVPTNQPPVASFAVQPSTGNRPLQVALDASGSSDPDGVVTSYAWAFGDGQNDTGLMTSHTFQAVGTFSITLTVTDNSGATATTSHDVVVTLPPNQLPTASFSATPMDGSAPLATTLDGGGSNDPDGSIVSYAWDFSDGATATGPNPAHTFASAGTYTVMLTVTDDRGANATARRTVVVSGSAVLPPDPATIAPPLDQTVVTPLAAATAFLYSGATRIQVGVPAGTIETAHAALLRGFVKDTSGNPLPGVVVRILNEPQFGSTVTRADGMFDLVVNGGRRLTVDFQKPGLFRAQREVDTQWQTTSRVTDVAMVAPDPQVSPTVDLTAATPIQVARGSAITEASKTRRATLFFPQGTSAHLVFGDGRPDEPITSLSVRATEFTQNAFGFDAMSAELPPDSAYTYALTFTADEAQAENAKDVVFNPPLPFYVENFLGFPVATDIPLGSYDPDRGVWDASDNGRVIEVVSIDGGGLAELDTDGTPGIDNGVSLGITGAERAKLGELYTPGTKLWRLLIPHFDRLWDANLGYGPPENAGPCECTPVGSGDPPPDPPTCHEGSVIACQTQTLKESLPLTGTPYQLGYSSDRTPGNEAARSLRIFLSNANLPGSPKRIELEIDVAGHHVTRSYQPVVPNLSDVFIWDGTDIYGRTVQGQVPTRVRIGYVYEGVYQIVPRFGYKGNGLQIGTSVTRREVTLWETQDTVLGAWDARASGLGGWSLDVHHAYDPVAKVLYTGDGQRRDTRAMGAVINSVVRGASELWAVAVGAEGTLYYTKGSLIRAVDPQGVDRLVAGTTINFGGDGFPANDSHVAFNGPLGLAVGRDGSLYIADTQNHRVRRIGPDGIVTTVAGAGCSNGCQGSYVGEGIPAINSSVRLQGPNGVAVGPDGSLFIADGTRIRRVTPDGIISTAAGSSTVFGTRPFDGDVAVGAAIGIPTSVAVGPDGTLYFPVNDNRILGVGSDGLIRTVAGVRGMVGYSGDGGSATLAKLKSPNGVSVGPDGSLYFSDQNTLIRRVSSNGIITTVAGTTTSGVGGDGGPAELARMTEARTTAVASDGSLYVANLLDGRIRVVKPALPGLSAGDILLASEDASEVYEFSPVGRHLRTRDALTGGVLHEFGYSGGLLSTVTDRGGNLTTIARPTLGQIAITAPGTPSTSRRTLMQLDGNGFAQAVTNPNNETTQLVASSTGLLQSLTDARQHTHGFQYYSDGRLRIDTDPAGGAATLSRSGTANDYTVTLSTVMGRTSTYRVERLASGATRRTDTNPAGLADVLLIGSDETRTRTYPDRTTVETTRGPDLATTGTRFGMQAPVLNVVTIRTPGELLYRTTQTRSATLADPTDPFSLVALKDTTVINNLFTFVRDYAQSGTDRTITETSAALRHRYMALDASGRVLSSELEGFYPVRFGYDSATGLLRTIKQGTPGPGGDERVYNLDYDAALRLASITNAESQTVSFPSYDGADRVLTQALPDANQVTFTYDANGNLTTLTPPGEYEHGFGYTSIDLEQNYLPPPVAGVVPKDTTGAYTLDRQLDSVTRPDGQSADYVYDDDIPGVATGRLRKVTLPEGDLTYDYTPATAPSGAGRLASIARPDGGKISYGYDGFLPTDTTWGCASPPCATGTVLGKVTRAYDNNLRVSSETVGDSTGLVSGTTVTFGYDNDGLLTAAGSLTITRDSPPQKAGLINTTTLGGPGGVTDQRTYDRFGELKTYGASYGALSLLQITYDRRDGLGRIVDKTESILGGVPDVYHYEYDAIGRLKKVTKGTVERNYDYDPNGNRTAAPNLVGIAAYDDQDRLTRYGPVDHTYAYSNNGDLTVKRDGDSTTTYTYDAFGNLQTVHLPDGRTIEYVIDGQNRRIGKKVNGELVQAFLYSDQLRIVAELDGDGHLVSRFVYGERANVPDYMVRGEVTYRIVTDHLGSVRLVVAVDGSMAGAVSQRTDYDEFGIAAEVSGAGFQPFGFAGGLYDSDTRLVRFGARDYDPTTGRWLAKDPSLFAGGDPNLYGYSGNDPVNRVDPTGLDTLVFDGFMVRHYGDSGEFRGAYSASSGRCEKGPPKCDETTSGFGPIPPGTYLLNPNEASEGGFLRNLLGDWGTYRAPLHPVEGDTHGRTGFYLHGGTKVGSAGCIDLGFNDQLLFPWLLNYPGYHTVIVK